MRDLVQRLVFACAIAAFLGIIAEGLAEACVCSGAPSCGDLTKATAVMEATVESIELVATPKMPAGSDSVYTLIPRVRVARLKDVKAWRGDAPTSLISGFGDCEYTFHAGTRYLIVPERLENGDYGVGGCSFIREIKDAGPILDYLKALNEGDKSARAIGRIARVTGWDGQANAATPVKGAEITISGPRTYTRISDDAGRFDVRGLATGKYSVSARVAGVPVPMEREAGDFWIEDAPACTEIFVSVPATGRVQGFVLDEDGSPLKGALVDLLSADSVDAPSRPGYCMELPEGEFLIDGIPAGRYTISMNRGLGPNTGAPFLETETPVFIVEEGRTATAPTLRVTRATPIKVSVIVRDGAGAPLPGVQADHFRLLNNGKLGRLWPPKTDAQGRYDIELWKGLRYVVGIGPEHDPWGHIEFVADGRPITITANPR